MKKTQEQKLKELYAEFPELLTDELYQKQKKEGNKEVDDFLKNLGIPLGK